MNRTIRRLAVVVLGLAAPLALAAPPAQAGGDPPYPLGSVQVDARAALSDSAIHLSGSYVCEGAGDRIGSFRIDVLDRTSASIASAVQDGLSCDGATHSWFLTMDRRLAARGPYWAHGMLQVCESAGGVCPGTLFDQRLRTHRAH